MEQIENRRNRVNHLAGIVPVAGQPLDFKMPWHDALMPIAPDYLAVERAVYQCSLAGCTTIWIVCHAGIEPLIRKRIGDAISTNDYSFITTKDKMTDQRKASIFYVPIHPKDKDKRDCLSWSVMYGANSAYGLCKFISRWVIPDKFYCSFPYCIMDDEAIKKNKELLVSHKNVIFSHNGQTVKDGLHINLTFKAEEFKTIRRGIRRYVFEKYGERPLNISQKLEAAFIPVEEAFKPLDLEHFTVVECPWFYDISSWEGYSNFIGAKIPLSMNRNLFIHRDGDWYAKI